MHGKVLKIGSDFDILTCHVSLARTITSWQKDPLVEPDASDPDYVSLLAQYEDACFMDELCERVSELPSIQGLIQSYPDIEDLDLFYIFDSESEKTYGSYWNEIGEIELNFGSDTDGAETIEDLLVSVLGHELRHGFQEIAGIFDFKKSEHKDEPYETMAFNRIIEADASVFGIVVAYELGLVTGDYSAMKAVLKSSRGPSARAYLKAVKDDPNTHWTGEAANHAFTAYFSRPNAGLLQNYDTKISSNFFAAAGDMEIRPLSQVKTGPGAYNYIDNLPHMPFVNHEKHLQNRESYCTPLQVSGKELMGHVSRRVRSEIKRNNIEIIFE